MEIITDLKVLFHAVWDAYVFYNFTELILTKILHTHLVDPNVFCRSQKFVLEVRGNLQGRSQYDQSR